MVVHKNKKLELKFKLYLRGSLRIQITYLSDALKNTTPNMKLYTDPDGFIIDTGYVCSFNRHNFSIPTYVDYEDYTDSDLYAYFNFMSDSDRYNSLKRLHRYMIGLSQSRLFQYDNAGFVQMEENKWIVY